jgi:hypothetical protein
MISDKVIEELEELVNKGLEVSSIPVSKGNSIRIKHIVVRKSPNGYLIYDTKNNKQLARTMFKSTALAIAKNLAENKDIITTALYLDKMMLKHYTDAIFYKNTIKKTKDEFKKEVIEIRLSIAIEETNKVRNTLDRYIFS